MIEVLAGGPLSTLQDRGRRGLRRLGVPWAGALAPAWMTLANALVGNPADAPVIECFEGGLRLRAGERTLLVAHVGHADVVLVTDGTRRALAPWRGHRVPPGAEIALRGSGAARLAVLAIRDLRVPITLGSASTYAKAALGGVDGRPLAAGDRLALADEADGDAARPDGVEGTALACAPFGAVTDTTDDDAAAPVPLRAVPGPQRDAFDAATLATFFDALWTLSAEADRMGARLDGPTLAHRDPACRDIASDAIVPGSVQVPGSGQPIVMLADAHTAGGYPKIATVISTDLALLAVHRPGTRFRLVRVDVDAGIGAARDAARALAEHLATLRPAPAALPDTARLLACNLVDGVTDGASPED